MNKIANNESKRICDSKLRLLLYGMTITLCVMALVLYVLYTLTEQHRRQRIVASYAHILIDEDDGCVKSAIVDSKGNNIDFNELCEDNPSVYGYIDIVGTDIQSPIEVNDYGRHAMLYSMSDNTDKFSERNVVVYVDSERYPDITCYKDKAYIKEHLQINVSSLDEDMTYKIFAIGYCDNRNIMSFYNFGSFSGLISYIDYVKSNCIYYDDSCNIDTKSGIITFSTDISGERLLVLAVMGNKP